MDLWVNIGWVIMGLVLLYIGAEWLVKGASQIALGIGISPLVVGLTVVAFGTSAPELLVSLTANLQDPPKGNIALGNVVGSNICNIALILAVSALLRPLRIHAQVVKREMPIMLLASAVFILMLLDGGITRWEAGILAAGVIIYTIVSIFLAKKEPAEIILEGVSPEDVSKAKEPNAGKILLNLLCIVVGIAALSYGANRLVTGGVVLAGMFGVPDVVIGLTMIALGTSLPELATAIVATTRGEGDIVVGNVIGSNIFNVLCVVGFSGLVSPLVSDGLGWVDFAVMFGLSLVAFPLMKKGGVMKRADGGLLLAGYAFYLTWLAMQMS